MKYLTENTMLGIIGGIIVFTVGVLIYAGWQAHKDIKNFKSRDYHDMFN